MNLLESILGAQNGGAVKEISRALGDGVVTLKGMCDDQAAKEKCVLMAGNVEGVEKVEADGLSVPPPPPKAPPLPRVTYYSIKKGDTLYGIAKQFYGNGMKYKQLFEANREVIEDPDKIYPGQKIRVPESV